MSDAQSPEVPEALNCPICQKETNIGAERASDRPLVCDDCPSTFHPQCLGYMSVKQFPRGKWKCYFCKVARHGLCYNGRMSPNEKAYLKDMLNTHQTWQIKAQKLLTALAHWFCLSATIKEKLAPGLLDDFAN